MNVELRHLRALVAVADSKTFTEAAASLGLTQPTLSRTIAQLEQVVERRLVERTTRQTTLTEDGRFLVQDARAALTRLDRSLTTLTSGRTQALRVGWTWAAFGEQTAPLLRAWKEEAGTDVEVVPTLEPFSALDAGELDAAIVRKALPDEIDYEWYQSAHLYAERLVAAASTEHPLARQPAIELGDLTAERVALCSTTPTATLNLWSQSAIAPRTVEVDGTDEWLARIVLQEAVGVTSLATSYNYPHPEVRYIPIEDSPTVEVLLTWPTERPHRGVDAFARFARSHFRSVAAAPAAL